MSSFIIREFESGALIPLRQVIARFAPNMMAYWVLRNVRLYQGMAFGLASQIVEERSNSINDGFRVLSDEFTQFLSSESQIIDGYLFGFCSLTDETPALAIECVDASQWEISTNDDAIVRFREQRTTAVG